MVAMRHEQIGAAVAVVVDPHGGGGADEGLLREQVRVLVEAKL